MSKLMLLAVSALLSTRATAGEQLGTVSFVAVRDSDGLIYFGINGAAKTGSPSCATNSYWVIRDENSNAGKQQYAMVLAAQAAGRTVQVSGFNTCTRWGDGEDVNWIRIVG